jgi:hypothetical protein
MVMSLSDQVRLNAGETIPTGGSDSDTNFTDQQIADLLILNNNLVNRTTAAVWRAKAALFAGLVDVQEGNSSRKMSQAYETAQSQAKYWASLPEGDPVMGRTRIGVNRRSMPW